MKKLGGIVLSFSLSLGLLVPGTVSAAAENNSRENAMLIPTQDSWVLDQANNKRSSLESFKGWDYFKFNGTPRGKLTLSVRYPDDEFMKQHTQDAGYISYSVYILKKDGTYENVGGEAVLGMPDQTYNKTFTIDKIEDWSTNKPNVFYDNEKDFTDTYIIEIRHGYWVNPDFEISVSFQPIAPPNSGNETEPNPEVPTEPKPEIPGEPVTPPALHQIKRLSGATRYDTNISILKEFDSHSLDNIIVASGQNYPDALTGGVLSNKKNGAILLVNDYGNVLTNAISESERLMKDKSNGKIIILGGDDVVSTKVEQKFISNGFKVERISGNTRIDTAIEVAKQINANPKEVFLTYGFDFADSLAIMPAAAKNNTPILLNLNHKSLSPEVLNYIKSAGIQKVTLIGGEIALSNEIATTIKNNGINVDRISGNDRVETALKIAKAYFSESKKVAVANGFTFADALSGGALAYKKDMPILLIRNMTVPTEINNLIKSKEAVYPLGGHTVISQEVENNF